MNRWKFCFGFVFVLSLASCRARTSESRPESISRAATAADVRNLITTVRSYLPDDLYRCRERNRDFEVSVVVGELNLKIELKLSSSDIYKTFNVGVGTQITGPRESDESDGKEFSVDGDSTRLFVKKSANGHDVQRLFIMETDSPDQYQGNFLNCWDLVSRR